MKVLVTESLSESVMRTVKFAILAAGEIVPEMIPSFPKLKPAGSAPLVIDTIYGATPPDIIKSPVKDTPASPAASVVAPMLSGGVKGASVVANASPRAKWSKEPMRVLTPLEVTLNSRLPTSAPKKVLPLEWVNEAISYSDDPDSGISVTTNVLGSIDWKTDLHHLKSRCDRVGRRLD